MTVESRGTSNTNDRGSAEARRQRKRWLFGTWAADVDVVTYDEWRELSTALLRESGTFNSPQWQIADAPIGMVAVRSGLGRPVVRCFRCGTLCDWESVEIDRIKPGCEGGRYAKNNIRPVCGPCNKVLAGEWVKRRNAKRKATNARRRQLRAEAKAHLEAEAAKCAAISAGGAGGGYYI